MIKILILILFTSLVIILAPNLANTQGFVHISTFDYVIETSLTTAIIVYLFSVFILFLIYIISNKIVKLPKGTLRAFRIRSKNKKLSLQDDAAINFEQGQYEKSLGILKHTSSIAKMSEKSLIIAAQSAFFIGQYDFTRMALDEAEKRGKQTALAANIVRARLNYKIGNPKVALEYLDKTNHQIINKEILQLYLDCYKALKMYSNIVALEKDLIKYKVLSEDEFSDIYATYIETELAQAQKVDDINTLYKQLKKNNKYNSKIRGAIVFKLLSLGDVNKARELSLDFLKKEISPVFLESISRWEIAIPDVLIFLKKHAMKNLITTQVNLPLLKAMANLEFKQGLLKDALEDYKTALNIAPSYDIYLRMGAIYSTLQNYIEANECYSRATDLLNSKNALIIAN